MRIVALDLGGDPGGECGLHGFDSLGGNAMKLYIVEVVRRAYALAPDEASAAELAHEVDDNEEREVTATIADRQLPGWDDDCYVYTCYAAEKKLGRAKEITGATW